jgi:hypothetical protein
MQEQVTFDIFQYAMIQARNTSVFEDFVVILQKLTSKDPVNLKVLMSNKLIETLNSEITKKDAE